MGSTATNYNLCANAVQLVGVYSVNGKPTPLISPADGTPAILVRVEVGE